MDFYPIFIQTFHKTSNDYSTTTKPAFNPDLWAVILDLVEKFPKLTFKWVKGHAGNVLNERADVLANSAANQEGGYMLFDEGYMR